MTVSVVISAQFWGPSMFKAGQVLKINPKFLEDLSEDDSYDSELDILYQGDRLLYNASNVKLTVEVCMKSDISQVVTFTNPQWSVRLSNNPDGRLHTYHGIKSKHKLFISVSGSSSMYCKCRRPKVKTVYATMTPYEFCTRCRKEKA